MVDCVGVHWSAATMGELMERYPRIALNALDVVSRRLQEVQTRLRDLLPLGKLQGPP